MENSKEVSRKEFLKSIPEYVVQNMPFFIQECLNLPFAAEKETLYDNFGDNKAVKVVQLEAQYCLAWDGGNCQFCYLVCPLRDKAITMDDQRPTINISFCDGCGRCVTVCQAINDRPALKMIYKRGNPEMPARPQSSQDKFAQAELTSPSAS